MTNQVGGWSSLATPDQLTQGMKQAEDVFGTLRGLSYQPLAAQEQVVEGMNYCYFSKAQMGIWQEFSSMLLREPTL